MSTRRALVIDDDRALARAVGDLLRDEAFSVDEAHDGDEGFALASKGSYDVIVLDVMLPKRNGFSLCADLRRAGVASSILMLTAKEGELDEVEGLDMGADDFLRKPFEAVVLQARIHALLRRRDRERVPALSVGGVSLDPVAHRVDVGAASVSFTPREFTLLQYLMQHRGEAVAKASILADVWGEEFDGDPNVIEVYVGYIRRKLDEVGCHDFIRTVRGVGYLVPDSR